MKIAAPMLLLPLLLAGCEVGPDYQPPETGAPTGWDAALDRPAADKGAQDAAWWACFHDPVLDQLILTAEGGNPDLDAAAARIAQSRASLDSATAALLPKGDIRGTATREANQFAFPGGTSSFGNLLTKPFNVFQAGFDASWELDLFGGNNRAAEAAAAQVTGSAASRDDALVSLMAEVARTYVEIRLDQAQIAVATHTVQSDRGTLDIAAQRVKVGDTPGLDAIQAESALQQAQTRLPAYRAALAQAEYSMDALTGQSMGATRMLIDASPGDGVIPAATVSPVLAAPADVIAHRPDIRAAERTLAAATAMQGVAVAKFFPDISLQGFFGALNVKASDLVKGASESWLAGAATTWPIFDFGTLTANLDLANAREQEALANYRKAVLNALADVNRAIAGVDGQSQVLATATAVADKDRRAQAIALERYRAGLTSFIDVLDADRTALASQERVAQAQADLAADQVALYKAMGGNWADSALPPNAQ